MVEKETGSCCVIYSGSKERILVMVSKWLMKRRKKSRIRKTVGAIENLFWEIIKSEWGGSKRRGGEKE